MLDTPHDAAEAGEFRSPGPLTVELPEGKLTLVADGQDRLAAVLDLIAGARLRLRLFYYAFAKDRAGTLVRDALAAAAGRGVAATLIVDDFAAIADERFLAPFTDAGGKVLRFSHRWNVRYLIRNHQKMLIADDRAALVGGFNIEDAYFSPPQENGWNDLGAAIEGEGVAAMVRWFDMLEGWIENEGSHFRTIWRLVRDWDPGEGRVRLLVGGPTRGLSSWARSVLRDIDCGHELDMMMAYFTPRGGIVRRIARLAARGRARLVLAGKTDNFATIPASRSIYWRLLRCGAEIGEFRPCRLHAKLVVIDDVTYLGSANFDMRSLYLNLEVMLRIEDAGLAARMREYIAYHMDHSERITPELHRSRSGFLARIGRKLAWFLVAVADYALTRRLNLPPLPRR
ncbi:MAG TPA: phospholipase D-like domain-containing protein [Sphingomonadaceae bacterium]|nr:phospholipase D-like domain-containing protein [Sphingomonadaceae bacterium]